MSKSWHWLRYRIVKLRGMEIYRVEHHAKCGWLRRQFGRYYHWTPLTRWEMDYTGEDGSDVPEEFSSRATAYERIRTAVAADVECGRRLANEWDVVD